jgi:hypothetical protein
LTEVNCRSVDARFSVAVRALASSKASTTTGASTSVNWPLDERQAEDGDGARQLDKDQGGRRPMRESAAKSKATSAVRDADEVQ